MDRPDVGLYLDMAIEPLDEGGFEVSISCDDPVTFQEGQVAQTDQALPWLITRIQNLIHKKLGKWKNLIHT